MRASIVAPALALIACDKVLGLNPVPLQPDALDAPPGLVVTGKLTQVYTSNDSNLEPITMQRAIPPSELAVTVTLDDGTSPTVAYNDDGTFAFPIASAGQAYRFDTTLYGATSEIQAAVPELVLVDRVAGRLMPRTIGSTTIVFGFPGSVLAHGDAYVATTGQYSWTDTLQVGDPLSGNVTFAWPAAQPTGNLPLGMLDASANDHVYALEYNPNNSVSGVSYTAIDKVSDAAISQQVNIPSMLPAVSSTATNACVHFATHNADEYARIGQVLTGAGASYQDFILDWMPDPDSVAWAGEIQIAAAGGAVPAQNLDLAPPVYVPMPGGQLVITAFTGKEVPLAVGSASPIPLYSGNRRLAKVPNGCALAAVDLSGSVAIPGVPVLDGQAIDVANTPVTVGNGIVTWQLGTGSVHYMTVALDELEAIGSATVASTVQLVTTLGPTARLDPANFKAGHTYVIAVGAHLGSPNAPTGDFSALSFPIENATTWSQSFVVQP